MKVRVNLRKLEPTGMNLKFITTSIGSWIESPIRWIFLQNGMKWIELHRLILEVQYQNSNKVFVKDLKNSPVPEVEAVNNK